MPNRYWVGGTGTWDGTAGTKWAEVSGGPGGFSVPNSTDDVFFDENSTGTVTISSSVAKSVNYTGFTGTVAGTGALSISGSLTLGSGMTRTYTGTTNIVGSGTITSNGITYSTLVINGAGIVVDLGDALISTGVLNINQGTFDTNDYTVAATAIQSTTNSIRSILLRSSTVTLTITSTSISTANSNLTFNAGTSEIIITGNGAAISAPDITFYNVTYAPTGSSINPMRVLSSSTFNNLTIEAATVPSPRPVSFSNSCTFNGGLFGSNTSPTRRVEFRSGTIGAAQTITVNGAYNIANTDFSDIYIIGTSAPLTGTSVANKGNIRGVAFSAPKISYWVGTDGTNWASNSWAATSGGTADENSYPLAQDIAVFDNAVNIFSSILINTGTAVGTLDSSSRTTSMTFNISQTHSFHGDLILGSGVNTSGGASTTFSGRAKQTIVSNGRTWNNNIIIDNPGGSVTLGDALLIASRGVSVDRGEFNTGGYNINCGSFTSNSSSYRIINLGSSVITCVGTFSLGIGGLLEFDAGTSLFRFTNGSTYTFNNYALYDIEFTGTTGSSYTFSGNGWSCRNLSLRAYQTGGATGYGSMPYVVQGDFTVTGTLSTTSLYDNPGFRIGLDSNIVGTSRTISVGEFTGNHIDFTDINIVGAAAPISGVSLGDAGGNSGIIFTTPKTVYWNLAGSVNYALGWALTSGGSPSIDNFPLPQDTAVWDDTGAAGTIMISSVVWRLPTLNFFARTTSMTFTVNNGPCRMLGDLILSSAVTYNFGSTWTVRKRGVLTLTSNGASVNLTLSVDSFNGTLQLADAFTTTGSISLTTGTIDLVSYNLTCATFSSSSSTTRTIKMGSGTWTLTSAGTVWSVSSGVFLIEKGTATILLSNNTTTARTFTGNALAYPKLIIGGDTSTSTTTIGGNNTFDEISSTKTVAHTIAFGSTNQNFGKWSVSGSSGNVVTLTGTGTGHRIIGSCTENIDYLAMGSIGFANTTSTGEFYAGVNSTGTASAPVYRTAKPADSTRYWVGGTGNWSDTSKWSTSSGGSGGASVPRSHDDVIFNSSSHNTNYTVTVDVPARVKSLSISGPSSGTMTFAGTQPLFAHDDITLPATGLDLTYSGALYLSGSTSGKILTTNGVVLKSQLLIDGNGCEWNLGDAISIDNSGILIRVNKGTFRTQNYNITNARFNNTLFNIVSTNSDTAWYLGSSTISGGDSRLASTFTTENLNLIFDAGTSSITFTGNEQPTYGTNFHNSLTFYNFTTNLAAPGPSVWFTKPSTFNNLTLNSASSGINFLSLPSDVTVNGTLTMNGVSGANLYMYSSVPNVSRTLTVNSFSGTDATFTDINVVGSAAPLTGTRIGDGRGNSGITFTTPKTVYWSPTSATRDWNTVSWASTSGGTPASENFPLPQDTAIIDNGGSFGSSAITIQFSSFYNYLIGTIDMSARTTGSVLITYGSTRIIYVFGDWLNSTVTSFNTNSAILRFYGRNTQNITSNGIQFNGQTININSVDGTVRLQDSLSSTSFISLDNGTFDSNNYNVTLSSFTSSNSNIRGVNLGSGTWTINGGGTSAWITSTSTNFTMQGSGTVKMNSTSAQTFAGGNISYSDITLDNSNAGTLAISGNNRFKDITNSYKSTGAATINLEQTIQRLTKFTGSGEVGRELSILATNATQPATLILTGAEEVRNVNYLLLRGVLAIPSIGKWYVGTHSSGTGISGFEFIDAPEPAVGTFFLYF
jgi:hypothetical protein